MEMALLNWGHGRDVVATMDERAVMYDPLFLAMSRPNPVHGKPASAASTTMLDAQLPVAFHKFRVLNEGI